MCSGGRSERCLSLVRGCRQGKLRGSKLLHAHWWVERVERNTGLAWRPLGTLNVVSNVGFHLAHGGISSLGAASLFWLLQELGNLDGLFVLLLQPLLPSSSSRCLFSAPPRPVQTFPAQAAARGCCRSHFSGFRFVSL